MNGLMASNCDVSTPSDGRVFELVSDSFLFQASDRVNVNLRVQVEAAALRYESVRQVCTRSNVTGYKKLNATIPIMLFWRANRHGSGYKPVMLLDLNTHSSATKIC